MHTFPLPKNEVFEWTEWFKAWQADPAVMQAADYDTPIGAVNDWLHSADGMSDAKLGAVDKLLRRMADVPPTKEQIISKGMPWGGLQEKLLAKLSGKPAGLAPGCPFPEPEVTEETQPWLELLETGTFSAQTLGRTPVNFEVTDAWVALLQKSVDAGHATWLHLLFLGTHALEVGNAEGAVDLFRRSMKLQPSVHAARSLALVAPTQDEVVALFMQAWDLWAQIDAAADPSAVQLGADLSGEILGWLFGNERWDAVAKFVAKLDGDAATKPYLETDRGLHVRAALAVHNGDFKTALPILRGNCFPTYGSLRSELIDLWFQANVQKEEAAKGESLARGEILALRKRLRCDGDSSHGALYGKCICGPPNLGYAY
jgi:hypothetical protein